MIFESKRLTDNVYVRGQISIADIDPIVESGLKSIIVNRPDNEADGQPASSDIIEAAEKAGLSIKYIPMNPGQISGELIQDMGTALETLPKPVLAYCASGTRSTVLWCCANVGELGADAVLSAAADAGYDLEQIRPLLHQLSK